MKLTRRTALGALTGSLPLGQLLRAQQPASGQFAPTWESLQRYRCPEWFRDAKFGIWAHWGPQSVPMSGDWYARKMYEEGSPDYKHHLETWGHPSKHGFKDIIPLWKAEKFDPDRLMYLYKGAGARYFVSMGVHHDNFLLWNWKHHRWNAVRMGPMRDIVGDWQKAARRNGLRFGVSEHMAASFTSYQASHGSDKTGALAGLPYDGADPQWEDLYRWKAQPDDKAWYTTDLRWAKHWADRITDLVDQYQPDRLYSAGTLPFGEVGRAVLVHYYNSNVARHGGKLEAVYTLKDWRTRSGHGDYVEGIGVQDVERGGLAGIKPEPWQTDTAIGDCSSKWVIHTMVDVVSKNGNLLLNVIQRPDGSIDPEVAKLLADVTSWMKVNGEAIHDTRPWRIYGEGTATEEGHFKEDFAFSAKDVRITQAKDGKTAYAITLGKPANGVFRLEALKSGPSGVGRIRSVELLGSRGLLKFGQKAEGARITMPDARGSETGCAFRVRRANLEARWGPRLFPPACVRGDRAHVS